MRNVASDLLVEEKAMVASLKLNSLGSLLRMAIKGSWTYISLQLLKERVGLRPKSGRLRRKEMYVCR